MRTLQHLLVLWASSPDPASGIASWSHYAPGDWHSRYTGEETEPPYASVLQAMADGWRIIHYPELQPALVGHEQDTFHLKHRFVLERLQEHDHA